MKLPPRLTLLHEVVKAEIASRQARNREQDATPAEAKAAHEEFLRCCQDELARKYAFQKLNGGI